MWAHFVFEQPMLRFYENMLREDQLLVVDSLFSEFPFPSLSTHKVIS